MTNKDIFDEELFPDENGLRAEKIAHSGLKADAGTDKKVKAEILSQKDETTGKDDISPTGIRPVSIGKAGEAKSESGSQAEQAAPSGLPDRSETKTDSIRSSAKPPRSKVIRAPQHSNPLEAGEIGSDTTEIRTPLPRVDEALPKPRSNRVGSEAAELSNRSTSPTSKRVGGSSSREKTKPRQDKSSRPVPAGGGSRTNTGTPRRKAQASLRSFFRGRVAGLLLLFSAGLELLLLTAWLAIPDGLFGLDKTGFSGSIIAVSLTQLFLVLMPSLLLASIFKIKSADIRGKGEMNFPLALLSFIIGIPAGLSLHALNNILIYFFTRIDIMVPDSILPGTILPDSAVSLPLLIMVTVIAPAVFEELMFRGILLPQMGGGGYLRSSLLLSSVGFALFHDDPMFWLAPFGAGLILGFLRIRTDNLYSPILTHMSMNLSMILVSPLLPQFTSRFVLSLGSDSISFFYANLIIAIVMSLLLMPLFVLLTNMTDEPIDLFKEDRQVTVAPAKKRMFFVSSQQKPADFSKLPVRSRRVNPYLDVFYWLACALLLTYLLSAYFVNI